MSARAVFAGLSSLLLAAAPASARAQQPAPDPQPHASARVLDASRVTGAVRYYGVRLETADSSVDLGTRVVSADSITYAGRAAWRVVASGGRGVLTSVDTIVMSRDSLRTLHWSSVLGVSRVSAELPGDTLFGGISTPLGRRSLVIGLPHDAIVGKESLDLLLRALPLGYGWRDSVQFLALGPMSSSVDSMTLSVDGEEHVVTPAGEFDTWVVRGFVPEPPVDSTADSARVATLAGSDSARAAQPDSSLLPSDSRAAGRDSTSVGVPAAPAGPQPAIVLWVDRMTGVLVREEQPVGRLHGRLVRELVAVTGLNPQP